jgi:hypothetical protein
MVSTRMVSTCIKNFESNLTKINPSLHLDTRNSAIPIFNNLLSISHKNNDVDNRLNFLAKSTNNFIRKNPQIMFTRADKGNITIALNSQVYKEKMLAMLQDRNTYENVKKDPTNVMTRSVREMLTRWKNRNYITSATYKKIYCSDGNLPIRFRYESVRPS